MKSLTYEPGLIAEYAGRLYGRARSIVASYTILGVLVGVPLMIVISMGWASRPGMAELALGALVGALIGYRIGSEKAFWLRLQAQQALCQVAIEANTRSAAGHLSTAGAPAVAGAIARPHPNA